MSGMKTEYTPVDDDFPPPLPNLYLGEDEVSLGRDVAERDVEQKQPRQTTVISRVIMVDATGTIAKRDYHAVPRIGEKFVTGAETYEITDVLWGNSGEPVKVRVKKLEDVFEKKRKAPKEPMSLPLPTPKIGG